LHELNWLPLHDPVGRKRVFGHQRKCFPCERKPAHSDVGLLGKFHLADLLASVHHVLVLDSHDATTPGAAELLILVVVNFESLDEGLKVGEVFTTYFCQGKAGSGLLVDNFAEVGFSTDEAEGHAHLAAESGEEDNHLNGVNVVSDHNKFGFLVLNELGNMVQAELDVDGLISLVITTSGSLC